MHIVAALTAIKGDRKTRLEIKGARSQLETLSSKVASIDFYEGKMYYFFKYILFLHLDNLAGHGGLHPRNLNFDDCGSVTPWQTQAFTW
jgi:hypothetical protein